MNTSAKFQIELFDLLLRLDITIEARVKVFQRLNRFKSELLSIQKNTKAFKIALNQEIIPNTQLQVLVYNWLLSDLMKDSDSYIYLTEQLDRFRSVSRNKHMSFKMKQPSVLDLNKLFDYLMDNELISVESTRNQFIDIFSGLPIEKIKPIVWGSNIASELLYFILKIFNHTTQSWPIYQTTQYCFVRPNGLKFEVNWKQLKTNIEINISNDRKRKIDHFFDH